MSNGRPLDIRLRGIRQIIPTGHIIGRTSPGSGQPELIDLAFLAHALLPVLGQVIGSQVTTTNPSFGFLVNGDLPGPVFMNDTLGQPILVPL